MSGKNQVPITLNWQTTTPVTGFLPLNARTANAGSVPSGTTTGAMASTNTIYSQIIDVSRMDNIGLEINFAGTGTGTVAVQFSNSGANFYTLAPTTAIVQPAGSSGGGMYGYIDCEYRYMLVQYTNTSGTGSLTVYVQLKDKN